MYNVFSVNDSKNNEKKFSYVSSSSCLDPIMDTGSTNTLLTTSDYNHLKSTPIDTPPSLVHLPNGESIESTCSTIIQPSHSLPPIVASVFPDNVLNRSLVSLSDCLSDGYQAIFTNTSLTIVNNHNEVILRSDKSPDEKLWKIPIFSLVPPPASGVKYPPLGGKISPTGVHSTPKSTNHVITHQHNADYVQFIHAVFGSPSISTFTKAISKGFLSFLPRLTTALVTANPPISIATAKGHLDRHRQGIRSTSEANASSIDDEDVDDNHMYIDVDLLERVTHADVTGKFPVQSTQGSNSTKR